MPCYSTVFSFGVVLHGARRGGGGLVCLVVCLPLRSLSTFFCLCRITAAQPGLPVKPTDGQGLCTCGGVHACPAGQTRCSGPHAERGAQLVDEVPSAACPHATLVPPFQLLTWEIPWTGVDFWEVGHGLLLSTLPSWRTVVPPKRRHDSPRSNLQLATPLYPKCLSAAPCVAARCLDCSASITPKPYPFSGNTPTPTHPPISLAADCQPADVWRAAAHPPGREPARPRCAALCGAACLPGPHAALLGAGAGAAARVPASCC